MAAGPETLYQSQDWTGSFADGIAQKLRGAADQYVHEKLDEIERRIDCKLDEIDGRLNEWRDREVRNRLRIIKITLITAILVAIISLGYDYLKSRSEAAMYTGGPAVGLPAEVFGEENTHLTQMAFRSGAKVQSGFADDALFHQSQEG